jgi:hypothetical protein
MNHRTNFFIVIGITCNKKNKNLENSIFYSFVTQNWKTGELDIINKPSRIENCQTGCETNQLYNFKCYLNFLFSVVLKILDTFITAIPSNKCEFYIFQRI